MSDNGEEEEEEKQQEANAEEKPKIKKAVKGTKNKDGDYVVTSINIPDMRTGISKNEKTGAAAAIEDDSSDEGYGDEEDNAEQTPAVEENKEGKYRNQRKMVTMVYQDQTRWKMAKYVPKNKVSIKDSFWKGSQGKAMTIEKRNLKRNII